MIQHYMYSSLLNIWSTARFSGLQGASLCRLAPPILSRARPRGKFLLSPWKYVKRKPYSWSCYTLAVIQGYSLHRTFSSQYQALGVIASVAAPGAQRMVSCSCLHSPARRTAYVNYDSGYAELVWVVCTHILVRYCWFSLIPPTQPMQHIKTCY